MRGPDPVDAHPKGASPFGVMDLVGNVWQWTDEFIDEHTRAAILRGGSYYQPQGSIWYFPQAYRTERTRQTVADVAQHGPFRRRRISLRARRELTHFDATHFPSNPGKLSKAKDYYKSLIPPQL